MQKLRILLTRTLQIPWSNLIVFRFRQAEFRATRSSAKKHSQPSDRSAQMLSPEKEGFARVRALVRKNNPYIFI